MDAAEGILSILKQLQITHQISSSSQTNRVRRGACFSISGSNIDHIPHAIYTVRREGKEPQPAVSWDLTAGYSTALQTLDRIAG